jgi:hypothetical protein
MVPLIPGTRFIVAIVHITPDHISEEQLVAELDAALAYPGVSNAWTMPIKGRIDMLTTGIRTPVGVKVSGTDYGEIERIGSAIETTRAAVRGTRTVFSERPGSGYFPCAGLGRDESFSLLMLFVAASIAIPLFYGAGLMYGQRSPLITAEYWRWWVFATVVIAFLFTRLKLLSVSSATRAVLFSTVVFLSGGIIGTFHHLYFTGAPGAVLAFGAVFSALEVVPLALVGFEAWENIRLSRGTADSPWVSAYKWPIYFFVAVAFWNFVGAGLFGFMINPPIALYYAQG